MYQVPCGACAQMFTRQGLPPAESNQVAVGCELAQEKGLFLSNGSFTLPETNSGTDWVSDSCPTQK